MSPRLTKKLYSSFLRIARKFDRNPAAKALLHRKSISSVVRSPAEMYHKEIIDSILHKGKLFNPINCFMPLEDRVAEEFRKRHEVLTSDRIDVGFALLRSLSTVWASYEAAMKDASWLDEYESAANEEEEDEEEDAVYDFPVRLTSELNSGTLLVAHPLIQGHTQRAVVLLLTCNRNGAYGLVVNRPTDKTLAGATRNVPADILAEFGENPVRYGGATRRLQFLHPFDSIGGNVVANSDPPIFAGGSVEKALELVGGNPEARRKFSFYAGCCFWSTKAIQSEIQAGFWIPVLAPSRSVVAVLERSDAFDEWQRELLQEQDHQGLGLNPDGEETDDEVGAAAAERGGDAQPLKVPSALGSNSDIEEGDGDRDAAGGDADSDTSSEGEVLPPPDLWNCLLQGLGNDYASIATFPAWLDASKVESLDWK